MITAEKFQHTYNFGFIDESTKKEIRRKILKAVSIPGYQDCELLHHGRRTAIVRASMRSPLARSCRATTTATVRGGTGASRARSASSWCRCVWWPDRVVPLLRRCLTPFLPPPTPGQRPPRGHAFAGASWLGACRVAGGARLR